MRVCACVCVCARACVCVRACVFVRVRACVRALCVRACMYIYTCVCARVPAFVSVCLPVVETLAGQVAVSGQVTDIRQVWAAAPSLTQSTWTAPR